MAGSSWITKCPIVVISSTPNNARYFEIEVAVINEVLEYLGTEARKGIHEQEQPKYERPNML